MVTHRSRTLKVARIRWGRVVAIVLIAVTTAACQPAAPEPTGGAGAAKHANEPDPVAIALIEPGTKINPDAPPAGTHLIFRSTPKVTSGDVAKVRKSILEALHTFTTLVIVKTEPDPKNPGAFRKTEQQIGVGSPGDGGDVVITKSSAEGLGIDLGLLAKQVLVAREEELSGVKSPGATPTMAMFDFPTNYRRDGKRTPILLRYAALVDTSNGTVKTLYWIIDLTPDGFQFSGDSLWRLPPNHKMDWEMHIDGKEVGVFGAPGAEAFTTTKLPQGAPIAAPEPLKKLGAARGYGDDAANKLEMILREALTTEKQ